eukprot:351344-Chlamydomonas_euryale.AAC.2
MQEHEVYAPCSVCKAQPTSTLRLGMNAALRHMYAPRSVCIATTTTRSCGQACMPRRLDSHGCGWLRVKLQQTNLSCEQAASGVPLDFEDKL